MNSSNRLARASVLLLLLVVLGACDKAQKGQPATQVVAKVNGSELSVHQLNLLMSRVGSIVPEAVPAVRRQALEQLVDQEVLVQNALSRKLDRDPQVVQLIEQARREILARSVVDQLAASAPKPDAKAVTEYYEAHPELFAERRLFSFQELSIQKVGGRQSDLEAAVQSVRSLGEVADWLKQNKMDFAASSAIRSAEQLPLDLVPRFQRLREGQLAVMTTPMGATVVQLASSKAAPLSLAEATPLIEQFLTNQARADSAVKQVKALRAGSAVEFRGEFAGGAPAPAASSAQKVPGVAAPAGRTLDAAQIDRGIAGLK